MAKIIIDGITYEVDEKKNLLEAILSLKLNLQYFCWHPAMGSVGACRQCAIKKFRDENDTKGKLFMACMEPIQDGMRISIEDPEAKEFRAGVIEWLMTNHPHDCPVCDEGGECHLQDMTYMSGHNYRRYKFKKRTHRNQYLGPFINHEMNRCIQCYRCVRYYRDYAGGHDFNVFSAHNHVYFGRYEEGVLESEFSGNLIEVCPTGVFTDKTLQKHYTRKWDLTSAPSICVHCGVGCNTIAGERYGKLRRIQTRYNGEVNGFFLCDRGRFGYEFVNHDDRIRKPLIRASAGAELTEADEETAMKAVSDILRGSNGIIGIGSPRASLESNYMLRSAVSEKNFYWGVTENQYRLLEKQFNVLNNGAVRTPSLREIEKCDAILVLGEDLTNTAPMVALALRQSVRREPLESATAYKIPQWQDASVRQLVQDQKGPVFVATPYTTKLDDVATSVFRGGADEIARFGYALAGAFSNDAPRLDADNDETASLIRTIVEAFNKAERPLIIAGPSLENDALISAAANIAYAMKRSGKNAELCYITPECNSMGMVMMGGKSLNAAVKESDVKADTVIILENDIYRRMGKSEADKFLGRFKNVIVLDHLKNETVKKAHAVISVGSFAESDGTFVNNEGRAQRFFQVYMPNKEIKESWRWLRNIMAQVQRKDYSKLNNLYDFTRALIKENPFFEGIDAITPPPGFRIAGEKIPRAPHRFTGRTAMHANESVHEPKPPVDPDSPLSFTMEGFRGQQPSSMIPFIWSPGWNSSQAIHKYQIEVGGPLHGGDPGKRLLEPTASARISFFTDIPKRPVPQAGLWTLVPVYHIYGSEELSSKSNGVAELLPQPYVMFSAADAALLGITKGSQAEITIDGRVMRLPVKLNLGLPGGIAGYPVGFNGMEVLQFPATARITGVAT